MAKCCPICGSECYETVKKNITGIYSPGACIKTLHYVCTGCSVMFQDPERFFRGQEGTFADRMNQSIGVCPNCGRPLTSSRPCICTYPVADIGVLPIQKLAVGMKFDNH